MLTIVCETMGSSVSTESDRVGTSTGGSAGLVTCLPLEDALECIEDTDNDKRTEDHVARRLRAQSNGRLIGVKHDKVRRFFDPIDAADQATLTGDNSLRKPGHQNVYYGDSDSDDNGGPLPLDDPDNEAHQRSLPSPYMGGDAAKKGR
jgi:hypothetical protein